MERQTTTMNQIHGVSCHKLQARTISSNLYITYVADAKRDVPVPFINGDILHHGALMKVGVGYSDNPDTAMAGAQAAKAALEQAGIAGECDLVVLFATARHDPAVLREAVASVVGGSVRVVGGAAVGTITNDEFGYAGDQIGLAVFRLDGVSCDILYEGGLANGGEEEVGFRLGRRMAEHGITRDSQPLLFYDAVDRSTGGMRLIMATPLLAGIHRGLGFLPDMVGAGLQGDFTFSPTRQWIGDGIAQHHAFAMSFDGKVRLDSVILHGCRPSTGYYTVTKADKQVILEINNRPALQFMQDLLGPSIPPEDFAFFLIFGINRGDKWGEFDERIYANRLCLAIDREKNGIVMFEPDMVEGTSFQIMHRSLDLGYMAPKIESVFARLKGRRPAFAFYIDCAGRAAGYAGIDLEDATMVQRVVAGRAPLLGIYSGVEIASVMGLPRALDWTGVFSLFSVQE